MLEQVPSACNCEGGFQLRHDRSSYPLLLLSERSIQLCEAPLRVRQYALTKMKSCRSSQSAVERQVTCALLTNTGRRSNDRSGRGRARRISGWTSAGTVVGRWRRIRQQSAGYRPVGVNQPRTSASRHGELTLPARSGRSLPSLDSSHSGEAVCFQSTYHMDRSVQICCRPLLCLSCYFALCVVSVFEQ